MDGLAFTIVSLGGSRIRPEGNPGRVAPGH